jgi:hypothetical protein
MEGGAMIRRIQLLSVALVLPLIFGVGVWAQTTKIIVEAMSNERLSERKLTTNTSTGLTTVPKGTFVYLSAQAASGSTLTSVVWSLQTKPPGSSAKFDSANAAFTTIRVDTTGQYVVKATITTNGGVKDTTITLTAANFVGVGSVGGKTASLFSGQCGACHAGQLSVLDDKVTPWSKTLHGSTFQRGIDGQISSHWSPNSCTCHSTGFNTEAKNGNYYDVMKASGYTPPTTMKPGNFDSLVAKYPNVAQLATVGCESCHGPGSLHFGDDDKISRSLDVGVCAQCHDSPWRYPVVAQWKNSVHSNPIYESVFAQAPSNAAYKTNNLGNCVRCHDGRGFVNFTQGKGTATESLTGAEPFSCAVCHEPHSAANPYQLRKVTADTLANGTPIALGGLGQLCMNCHKNRANGEVVSKTYSSRFGPHHNPQTDMLLGTNAAEFGTPTSSSGHKYALQDACVDCHMYATPDTGKPGKDKIGGHSWAMEADGVENVAACQSCHGPIKSFDDIKAAYDYDRNGRVGGIQTEVKGMLARLGNILPKQVADSGKVLQSFTQNQLRAAYDYFFVLYDGSYGVHNAKYAIGLLQKSMDILTGVETVNYDVPETYALTQNFPNPFNPTTEIQFGVPRDSKIQIIIYDILGRKVKTLVDNLMAPGTYRATWDGRDDNGLGVASGVYLYRIVAKNSSGSGQDFVLTKKMILMK